MKKGIIFGLGALVGGGIGAGTTILVLKRKINKQKDEEIEEVRRYYKEKCKKCDYKTATLESTEGENSPKIEENVDGKPAKLSDKVGLAERNTADVGRKKVTRASVDYTKYSSIQNDYTGQEASELFTYPHEIDEEEYDLDEEDVNKVILTYYESDDIFADINDRKTGYVPEDFGFDNLKDFGWEGIKYLRNDKTNTKYKIIYEGALSFDEATGGVNLNDP